MKLLCTFLCLVCLAAVTRKGAETLVRLAKQGQRQKALAAMVPPLPPTNVPAPSLLRAIVRSNYPPLVPPRTSVLMWKAATWPDGTNRHVLAVSPLVWFDYNYFTLRTNYWLTWLERSTNWPPRSWRRITPAYLPQITHENSAIITNVWPQFIRAAEGYWP